MRRAFGRRTAVIAGTAVVVLVAAGAAELLNHGGGGARRPDAVRAASTATATPLKPHPRVVVALAPGQTPPGAAPAAPLQTESEPNPPAAHTPSDAQVRSEIAAFRAQLDMINPVRGAAGTVLSDGTAVVPVDAPAVVAAAISAANQIATRPYKWGGGHGGWADTGYDCSGSVSFALAGARLLNAPLDSTGFMSYGDPGPGRWISIYANPTHVWMIIGNLRFDTSGETTGTRWQSPQRSTAGFVVRHPPGL